MKPAKIILSLAGERRELSTADLPPIPANLPTVKGNEPVTYCWKVMAAPGTYRHPKDGRTFTLTEADFRQMQRTHAELREKQGFHPFLPTYHTLKPDGNHNLGRLIDVIEHDGLLIGLHEFIGENARQIAAKNESSIYLETQFVDQFGKKWPNVITHNAIIPDPILTGLGDFVEVAPDAIAASRGAECKGVEQVPIYQLSRSATMNLAEQLRALLGLPADAADDAIFEGVKTKLATPTVDPAVQTELDATKAKLLAAENKIALSRSGQPSPEILEMQADRWTDKVDALVLAGKITPAKAAPIKAYIRTGGTPNAIALSRSGDKTAVEVLIDIAQLKDAPPTGEETGVQDPIELSRSGGAKDPMADAVEQAKQYAIKRNPK